MNADEFLPDAALPGSVLGLDQEDEGLAEQAVAEIHCSEVTIKSWLKLRIKSAVLHVYTNHLREVVVGEYGGLVQFADAVDPDPGNYSKWLRGKSVPGLEHVLIGVVDRNLEVRLLRGRAALVRAMTAVIRELRAKLSGETPEELSQDALELLYLTSQCESWQRACSQPSVETCYRVIRELQSLATKIGSSVQVNSFEDVFRRTRGWQKAWLIFHCFHPYEWHFPAG